MKKFFSLFTALLFAGSMMATDLSVSIKDYATANSWGNGTKYTTMTLDANVTATVTGGGNSGKYYTTGNEWRLYQNESPTITISTTLGTISSITITYNISNTGVLKDGEASVASGTAVTVNADSKTFSVGNSGEATNGQVKITKIEVSYSSGPAPAVAKPAISGEVSFFDETNVTISCSTDGAKIYYTLDGTAPTASSTEYTAAFKLTETKTVKAIAIKGDDKSEVAEKTFTKAPEYASIEALVAASLSTGSLVKVSFSEVEITGIYKNKSDKRFGIYLNVKAGEKDVEIYYTAEEVPATWLTGGAVSGTIKATWTLFNEQWEIVPSVSGWKWTDLTYKAPAVPAIIITTTSIDAPCASESGKINVTYNNIDDFSSAEVAFFEADGTTPATCDWINTSFDSDHNVDYTIAANEEAEARKAYLKVKVGEVSSDLVTITQAQYVPEFATLPFAFDGGKDAIATTGGLTQSGLGSDYTSSPKLKFDSQGDYVILKINETPGTLSFDIKGNPASGKDGIVGTFKVQTSADGETYTDLETYSNFTGKKSESFNNLASTVRYIKWIYSSRTSGNVALGNIGLSKASGTSLDNTASNTKAVKTIVNGQLIIEKAGVKYNVLGQTIR